MLDLTKKYWIEFGTLSVKCSIINVSICFNPIESQIKGADPVQSRIKAVNNLSISDESKSVFITKLLKHELISAYPGDDSSLKLIQEMEALGYTVFYNVDEPVGRDFTDDDLDEDRPPRITLEETRRQFWNSIHKNQENFPGIESQNYPNKKYGEDWY